ncbi:alpha/beta hydrolase [Nocardia inohanensis]|uniref:alpha/beta hydrolase n=1 Tax=Nocardia inohanensis TaxID=209246 RepID=UPI0008363E42|nr:alpha/beta fold hydrolase [Nocardia inohanensis]
MRDITFTSHGTRCAAWHLTGAGAKSGRPCVVMAHGFGGTRDTGLLGYAEPFAAAGYDVLVFDYRGWGDSEGAPRQDVSYRRQREDYHAAIAVARQLPGVDPERIVLWGTSYAGGHAVVAAARDQRIAAITALTPAMDGAATLAHILHRAGPRQLLRAAGHGLIDIARAAVGRAPHHVPIVGPPGSAAMMTSPGAVEAVVPVAGPTWRNEVCARAALEVGLNRPGAFVGRLRCPVLFQIGAIDSVAPPWAARRAAAKAGSLATIREYPVDHFDVYDGPWQRRAVADQLEFLARVLH